MANFSLSLTNAIRNIENNIDDVSVNVTREVFNTTMRPMRVDTGAMRGSNVVTQDTPAPISADRDGARKDQRLGAELLAEEQAKIQPRALNILSSTLAESYPEIWETREAYRGRAAAAFDLIVQTEVARNS